MAKQTFTTGSVLTATQMNNLQANDYNWTVSQKTASYVLVAADAGTRIEMNAAGATTVTVNTGLFTAGDTLFIQNIGAGACTVTAGTATVNKATAGSLTLSQYQGGTLYFVSASSAVFFADAGYTPPLTTKGDLFGFDTAAARIPIGSNNQVLTADSTQALGLKWATPTSGGMTLLSTTSLSGSSTSISVSSSYTNLQIYIAGAYSSTSGSVVKMTWNSVTASNYGYTDLAVSAASVVTGGSDGTSSIVIGSGSTSGADTTFMHQIFIPNYNISSSFMKICNISYALVLSAGSPARRLGSGVGYYNTASGMGAITSLQFAPNSGSWTSGTVYVYGVN